jgi:DNA (cytosine-5)-methyltransferase 1
LKYATVCSGIGAPEQAWKDLWGPPVFTSEIEPFPSAVLKHHYPDVPNLGDMTKYKEWNDYDLELICGGTPCQSFSIAGLRKGMDDPRGNLTLAFLGILARYNPRWFVFENVPGLFSSVSYGESDFGRFLSALAELGYSCAYRVLDAQYFGVPQRRRRVFVIGHLGDDWRPPFAVLFEPESLRGNPPKSREKGEGVAEDAGGGVKGSHWDGGKHPPLSQALKSSGGVGMSDQELFSQKGACLVMAHGQGNAEICKDGEPSLTCNHEAPICFQRSELRQSGKLTMHDKAPTLKAETKKGDTELNVIQPVSFSEGYFRCGSGHSPKNNGKVNTLQCNTGDQRISVASDAIVRRLTPMECERLQGFQDNFTRIPWKGKPPEQCPDGPRYKALGNSMAVPVVRWIGERIQMWESLNL